MAKRILIADDSLTIQKAFAMTFGGEDVTLQAARSADEGLAIARQARPELVIADAVMPGRSGYDLCAAIKADPGLRGVPVYILGSQQNPYDEVRGKQCGADGLLIKPFDSVTLVARVMEAIAAGVTAAAPPPLAVVRAQAPAPSIGQPSFGRAGPAAVHVGAPPSLDDDYGEISMEDSDRQSDGVGASSVARVNSGSTASENTPPPPVAAPVAPVVAPRPPAAAVTSAATTTFAGPGGLRPSLIPGLRPGAAPPPARPGTMPAPRPIAAPGFTAHPVSHPPSLPSAAPGSATQLPIPTPTQVAAIRAPFPHAAPTGGPARTLVGLPAAVVVQPAPRFGAPAAPARPPTQPVRSLDSRTPPPVMGHHTVQPQPTPPPQTQAPVPLFPTTPAVSSAVASKIDQKIAAIAAKGPEYEAIAKLSREIIEKIVWEVVPELAEVIIREELQKRGRL